MYRYGFVIIVLGAACPAFGADVFVAPTGSDDGPATVDRPLRTVQRGGALGVSVGARLLPSSGTVSMPL